MLGFPCGSAGKESACNVGNLGLIPGLGRSPEEEKGYPLQYSGLENAMDSIVHRVAESQTQLNDFHFIHFTCWAHKYLQMLYTLVVSTTLSYVMPFFSYYSLTFKVRFF